MLNVFDMDEVLIIKKGYDSITREYLDNNAPKRRTDKLLELMSLLKHTIKYTDEKGSYWKFDDRQVQYKPPFM
jgi:predicted metallo-beta-lactamase superfamily hydrolase